MPKIYFILFMSPLFVVASVVNNMEVIKFPVYVTEIAQEVGDLTASPDIWISEKFHYLFKNINLYIKDSLEVLSSDKFTDLEKHVVILAVQGLDLDNRILFAEKFNFSKKRYKTFLDESGILNLLKQNSNGISIVFCQVKHFKILKI